MNTKKFNIYKHHKILSRGTIVVLEDDTLAVIDDNDLEICESFQELNYYIFHAKDGKVEFGPDYNDPRYEMIHNGDIKSFSRRKIKDDEFATINSSNIKIIRR